GLFYHVEVMVLLVEEFLREWSAPKGIEGIFAHQQGGEDGVGGFAMFLGSREFGSQGRVVEGHEMAGAGAGAYIEAAFGVGKVFRGGLVGDNGVLRAGGVWAMGRVLGTGGAGQEDEQEAKGGQFHHLNLANLV